ncbi:MAG TPA: integration host factor subunit beta [Paucimonas sp.]|nr:integration host factor subunit beta [Paucimonas sp.]
MTKSELIACLAARYPQLPAKDVEYVVNTLLDAMTACLVNGQRIEVRGFGRFSLNSRPSRIGRNPKSGDKVVVPGKLVPHFKPGKELRERVDAKARQAAPSVQPNQSPDQAVSSIQPDRSPD